MANAERTTEKVEKIVVEEKPQIVLILSENEAETLTDILRRVGGLPNRSRRGYVSLILKALYHAGVSYGPGPTDIDSGSGFRFESLNPSDPRLVELAAEGL
jgi:hypothetical protein